MEKEIHKKPKVSYKNIRAKHRLLLLLVALFFFNLGAFAYGEALPFSEEISFLEKAPQMNLKTLYPSEEAWYKELEDFSQHISKEKCHDKISLKTAKDVEEFLTWQIQGKRMEEKLNLYLLLKDAVGIGEKQQWQKQQKLLLKEVLDFEDLCLNVDQIMSALDTKKLKIYEKQMPAYKRFFSTWKAYKHYGLGRDKLIFLQSLDKKRQKSENTFWEVLAFVKEHQQIYNDENLEIKSQLRHLLAKTLVTCIEIDREKDRLYEIHNHRHMSLFWEDISLDEAQAWKMEIERGKKELRRWKEIEKKLKRKHSEEGKKEEIVFSYEKALSLIKTGLEPLGLQYEERISTLLKAGIVDGSKKIRKIEGSYTWGSYDSLPYISFHFSGKFDDCLALAHELGHAVYYDLAREKRTYDEYAFSQIGMEMVAMTNEALIFETLLSKKDEDLLQWGGKQAILEAYAQSIEKSIFDQMMFLDFQKELYERIYAEESLDENDLASIWIKTLRSYGNEENKNYNQEQWGWTKIPQLYWGFYVQSYGIGYASGMNNAKAILEKPVFRQHYMDFLESEAETSGKEALELIGKKEETTKHLDRAIYRFSQILDMLEKYLDKKA